MPRRVVAGHSIEIVELGEGQPVVFLHGNGTDHRATLHSLDPVVARRTGYRRLHLDLPGYGASPGNEAIHGSDGMLAVVLDLLDALTGDEPVILVGSSWGAYLARGVVARRRAQVKAVAMLVPAIEADRARRDLDPFQQLVPAFAPLDGGTPELRAEFLEGAVIAGPSQWRHFRDAVAPAVAAADPATLDRIEAAYPFTEDVDSVGPPFAGPSLIVVGRQDDVVGYRDALRLVERYPRSTFAILDVAGHLIWADRPGVVAALLDDWLERVEGA